MRIRQIYLEKLFGMFNYKIVCNLKERITIIYGPNGYGKTTILYMIEALFKDEKTFFLKIPFTLFEITFEDQSVLRLKKKSPVSIEGTYQKNAKESQHFEYISSKVLKKPFDLLKSNVNAPHLNNEMKQGNERDFLIGTSDFENKKYDYEILRNYFDIVEKYNQLEKQAKKINDILPYPMDVVSINTQRLFLKQKPDDQKKELTIQSAVNVFSENLKNIMQAKLAESAGLSQSLDRSFPMRLVQQEEKEVMTAQELRATLKKLEEKRKDLIEVGLLDQEVEGFAVHEIPVKKIDANTITVLSVYARDNQQKLAIFDDIYARIKLFKKIINERFLHKKISITRTEGFSFTSDQGQKLALDDLSSGEKHQIVLLYQLLFNTNPDCLVLIDEPEISLHIAWQEVFLDNLLEIAQLRNLDIVIATHSPQIINDKWDLTVELKNLNA